jgi:bacillithiol system protein YtxJ
LPWRLPGPIFDFLPGKDLVMKWITLTSEDQLKNILEKSTHTPQVIYKHSKTCSISAVAKSRLEKNTTPAGVEFYFLDIWANRDLSDKVARELHVHHESPQVLLIKNGECIYDESHLGIRMDEIIAHTMAA